MDYVHKHVADRKCHGKLFLALTNERPFFCFAWLNLAANKLPKETSRLVRRALADEQAALIVPDEGGYYLDGRLGWLQAGSFRFLANCLISA